MSNDKWFMTSIEQTLTATGYIIVIVSDIPCHLWMRWTTVVPKEHLIQRTKRGLPLMLEKYFCFDVYEDNEQEEAGDTLQHTFIKEPWPICETRYFYFHGEISETPSPSTTAIFTKHRVAPSFGPPVWIECSLTQNPVWHRARDASWPVVRSKMPYGSGSMFGEVPRTYLSAGQYYIYRYGIIWDTSLIPAGSQIVQAYMRRYGYYYSSFNDVDFTYTWVKANAWAGGIDPNDYPIWNGYATVVASTPVLKTQVIRAWRDITLTPEGLLAIVSGGLTKMVAKTDVDNDNTDPDDTGRAYYWYGLEDPTRPQILHVQYRPPL